MGGLPDAGARDGIHRSQVGYARRSGDGQSTTGFSGDVQVLCLTSSGVGEWDGEKVEDDVRVAATRESEGEWDGEMEDDVLVTATREIEGSFPHALMFTDVH